MHILRKVCFFCSICTYLVCFYLVTVSMNFVCDCWFKFTERYMVKSFTVKTSSFYPSLSRVFIVVYRYHFVVPFIFPLAAAHTHYSTVNFKCKKINYVCLRNIFD